MSDEDADEEAFREEMSAFEARFRLEAFAGVAEALGLGSELETLSWLRRLFLPEFRFFVESCPAENLPREERIARLEKLRDAASAVQSSLGPGGARTLLPRRYFSPEVVSDQFRATLRALAGAADTQIQRLHSSRGRGGRPRKDAFWELSADLVGVYETLTGKKAKEPQWKGGSKYGGDFYEFVVAVEHCLRTCLPEVRDDLPVTSSALGDGLRRHWTSIREMAGEKLPQRKTQ
jgi:hypothetical protein